MDSLSAEHLLYASPKIHTLLAICFNAFIVHGFLPSYLTDSVIIPIVKDKCKNISDAGNYRPIALSSVLSKVFELILLSKLNSYFCTSDYQFGFKSHHSTDLCIVLIALSRCNRVFTRRLRLCHSHTVYRREVREGDREGPNRLESEV